MTATAVTATNTTCTALSYAEVRSLLEWATLCLVIVIVATGFAVKEARSK